LTYADTLKRLQQISQDNTAALQQAKDEMEEKYRAALNLADKYKKVAKQEKHKSKQAVREALG
jgi:hypothetical protein